jgi:hypothetical protein
MKVTRTVLAIFLVLSMVAIASAQKKGAQLRTVHGFVLDKQDALVVAGVVYLKNLKTQTIRTYVSNDAGEYRFSGLDPNVDYEIHAELNGMTSVTHTVSSFDTNKEIVLTLKLDKKKAEQ